MPAAIADAPSLVPGIEPASSDLTAGSESDEIENFTARRKRLQSLRVEGRTLVLYEAPHRVHETLEDCAAVFGGERSAMAAREITKMHETAYRGSLSDLCARAESDPDFSRGEIVLVIAGEPHGLGIREDATPITRDTSRFVPHFFRGNG